MKKSVETPKNGAAKKKEKRKISDSVKVILLIAVIAFAFIIFLGVLSDEGERRETVYSSYSANQNGTLALYYAMEEVGNRQGFTVSRHEKPARFLETPSIVLCLSVEGMYSGDYEISNMEKQIQDGSVYIFANHFWDATSWGFPDKEEFKADFYDEADFTYPWRFYKDGNDSGYLVCYLGDINWRNGSLLEDRDFGVDLMMLVAAVSEQTGIKNVVFDEYYHGLAEDYTADILSYGVYLCLIELLVAVVLLMLSRAKRFGAPRVEYSTVKRDENENVYAVASLYKRTKSYDVVFDIYMELLLADVGRVLGVTGDARFQYGTILEILKDSVTEKQYPALKMLAETYKRPKRKIKNKKDLKTKLVLIEELRRKLGDG